MKTIETVFYSELPPKIEGITCDTMGLLVSDETMIDIDEWASVVKEFNPWWVIPPYDPTDPARTSRCADMAKARVPNVGVVVAGTSDHEREEFFLWAQDNEFSPIVLLPHRFHSRERQIAELATPKYIKEGTWIHLPQPVSMYFLEGAWPGRYTTGVEFRRLG